MGETNKNILMTQNLPRKKPKQQQQKKVPCTVRSPGTGQPPFVNTDLGDTSSLSCHPQGIAPLMVTRWL